MKANEILKNGVAMAFSDWKDTGQPI